MRKIRFCMIFLSLLLIPLFAHSVPYTTVIDDNDADSTKVAYWGGSINNAGYANRDVIGDPYFSVEQMVVVQNDNTWTVTISGPYFNYHKNPSADGGLPYRLGPGDLYISSTGYSAQGDDPPHYSTDTFLSTEPWDYVVPILPTGGSGLYALNFGGITMTNINGLSGSYIYRTNQAWQGGATGPSLGTASYEFLDNSLIFTFDASALDFTSGSVGFHWAVQCGNDVLEGAVPARDVPVPEPSTILLLGLGLTGVAAYRKIKG